MTDELIKQLLEAGVHFGHQTKRWNPKMKRFIFGQRNGIYIIDLEKTVASLHRACDFVHDLASRGAHLLFVGTKRQAQDVIESEAKRANMSYVKNRWLGGLLTNFQTVKRSVQRLISIEEMSKNGIFENLSKKERARLTKERDKLARDLDGIRNMPNLPQAIFVIDTKKEEIAIREAQRLKIPVVGIVDTNCDPDVIDYPIPGNDDALKSVRLILTMIVDSVVEGSKEFKMSEKAKEMIQQELTPPEEGLGGGTIEALKEEIETLENTKEIIPEEKRGPTKVRLKKEKDRK